MKILHDFQAKRLAFAGCLLLLSWQLAQAQCNVTAVVEGNTVVYTVTNPTPGATYVWGADYSVPNAPDIDGAGTSFTVPLILSLPNEYFVRVESSEDPGNPCWNASVSILATCDELAGFTATPNGCNVKFTPESLGWPGADSYTWNFGDLSPTTHEPCPTHTYAPPGGTFDVTLWTVFSDYSTGSPVLAITQCVKPVTVVCAGTCGDNPTAAFSSMESVECCRLTMSFAPDCDECEHFWSFGNCGTSNAVNPVFVFENISTHIDGTPIITITHTITCPGKPPVTETLLYDFQNDGIFAGDAFNPQAVFNLSGFVSCQNGAPLFPGSSLSNTVVTRNVFFYSTVAIDKSYTFNNDQLCMDPCTGININPTRILTLNGGTVVQNGAGCGIWRGINIGAGNARLTSIGSTIRDAHVAVHLTATTSRVQLTGNNTFINNYVSFAAGSNFVNLGVTGNTFRGDVLGSMDPDCPMALPAFITEPPTYSMVQPFAGVYLANSNITGFNSNTFRNMANGIWFRDTNAGSSTGTGTGTLNLCIFQNMTETGFVNIGGRGIMFIDGGNHRLVQTNGTFDNCLVGIFDNVFGPGNRFRSEGNVMTNMLQGYRFVTGGTIVPFSSTLPSRVRNNNITSTGEGIEFNVVAFLGNPGFTNQLDIRTNTITATTGHGVVLRCNHPAVPTQNVNVGGAGTLLNTITVNSVNTGTSIGVWCDNFHGGTVDNNNITIQGTGSFARGISLNGGQGGTLVQFNNVTGNLTIPVPAGNTNFTDGILTENAAGNTYFNNAFANTFNGMRFNGACQMQNNIDCNSMTNHSTGMVYMTGTTITNPQNCGLNTWNAASGGAFYNGSPAQAAGSLYTTLPGPPQRPNPVAPAGWFIDGNCSGICPPNFAGDTPSASDADFMIATTGISTGDEYEGGINWLHKRALYRYLVANPQLLSNPSLQSFKAASDGQPLGQLYSVQEQIRTAFQLTATQLSDLDALAVEIEILLAGLEALDALLADPNLTDAQTDEYAAQRDAKASQLDAKYATVNIIFSQWMAQRNSASAGIVTANDAITTVADYDSNEKTLNRIYASKVLKGLPLTWQERASIQGIAKQCPNKGGPAVYWARAWYAALKGVEVQEEDCVIQRSSEGWENQPVASSPEFKLYPNPASTTFTLMGPTMPEAENWTISLYSVVGQQVVHRAYSSDGLTELSLQNLATGMYWCKVSDGKKLISVQRISVIK